MPKVTVLGRAEISDATGWAAAAAKAVDLTNIRAEARDLRQGAGKIDFVAAQGA